MPVASVPTLGRIPTATFAPAQAAAVRPTPRGGSPELEEDLRAREAGSGVMGQCGLLEPWLPLPGNDPTALSFPSSFTVKIIIII